jgi:hypothetical protein
VKSSNRRYKATIRSLLNLQVRIAYLVVSHESPCEDAHFLTEGDLVDRVWQVSLLRVDYVLKVLAESLV